MSGAGFPLISSFGVNTVEKNFLSPLFCKTAGVSSAFETTNIETPIEFSPLTSFVLELYSFAPFSSTKFKYSSVLLLLISLTSEFDILGKNALITCSTDL